MIDRELYLPKSWTSNPARCVAAGVAFATKPPLANFQATAAGYQALVGWVGTLGMLRRAGVESTGSYGAALARHLRVAGVEVIEVNAPDKPTRRQRGKTDTLDAEAGVGVKIEGRNNAGSSRTPLHHARRTRTIWQY